MISVTQGCIKAVLLWPRRVLLIWTLSVCYYSSFHFSQPMFWSPLDLVVCWTHHSQSSLWKFCCSPWTPHHPFTQPTLTAPAAPGKHFHDTPFFPPAASPPSIILSSPLLQSFPYLPPLQTEQLKKRTCHSVHVFLNPNIVNLTKCYMSKRKSLVLPHMLFCLKFFIFDVGHF